MKKGIKVVTSIFIVLTWMIIIYYFSAMPSETSNENSKKVIKSVVEKTKGSVKVNTDIENNNSKIAQIKSETNKIVDKLNKPLRKCMHASVYFILAILIFNLFRIYNLKNYKNALLTIIISFLYACTDEYHQTFIKGRTGQFADTLIDTFGAIFGVICICIAVKIIKKIKDNRKSKSL